MNLRKIAIQLLIMLNFVTAIPAANSQQGNLRGPKNSSPRYSDPQPQTQRVTQSDTYGPIVSSDTLWQISQNYRPNSSLSIYQVMQAIYDINPGAFQQNNINLLKNGSILKMPSEAYIYNVNKRQAQEKAQLDIQNLKSNISNISNKPTEQKSNAAALEKTRELIEQKLGAIDEAQNRQFMAIRKQFSESINSAKSILDENKKLSERLNKVNAGIEDMRSEEQQKSLQMDQMGQSIEELLEKSRQEDAVKAAQMAEKDTSWLDNPITLILLFTLPVLLALTAFAYWMVKRKVPEVIKQEEDDVGDFSLEPFANEMDDLSDSLSDKLSAETGNELDDAFGDSIEEKFEEGTDVVEQDDLDSIFDEDDLDSLFDEDDDLLADAQNNADSDLEKILLVEDEQQIDTDAADMGYEEDEPLLTPDDETIENSLFEDSDDINEEFLQNLDKEIISQSEKLDTVTGILIDELEQIEQIGSMLPDDDELLGEEESQLGIQTLDDLAEEIDEDVLVDELDTQDTELDVSEVLKEAQQQIVAEELAEPEQADEAEELAEPEQADETEEFAEPEQADEAEELAEPEQADETEELAEPEQADETEELAEPEQVDEAEELAEPEQADEAEELAEPEQADEAEELAEPEQADEAEALVEPEQSVAAEELAEPEQSDEVEALVEPEQADEVEALIEAEQSVAAEALAEPEQADEAEELAEPEQADEVEALVEPEQADEAEALIEPEQAVAAEALVEPEQSDEVEALVEPEQADDVEALIEAEQSVAAEELAEPEQSDEVEALVESEQSDAPEELAEPEQADEVEALTDESIDEEDEFDTELKTNFDIPADNEASLDEDQLEKALEDFEKEELDDLLEDLTSNEPASISSLNDLAFSADDFVTKDESNQSFSSHPPTLDDSESIDDFDDSELDNAFDETIDGLSFDSSQNSSDELDDLPGLGDWLVEDEVKPNQKQTNATEDDGIIEELEGSSFDEILESIDLEDDSSLDEDDTGFDIATLLDETPKSEDLDISEQDTEEFLDVEALLSESFDADDETDKVLDLDIPLEPFVNEQDNLEMIDVDADDGLGAKLDLAHAYIEIGEDDSARELLDEILRKGSAEQIAEVKIILNKLD